MPTTFWAEQMTQQDQIVRLATRELLTLATPNLTPDQFLIIFQGLIDKWGEASAVSALQAIENSRRAVELLEELPEAVIAEALPVQQVERTFAWAVNTAWTGSVPELAQKLSGPLGRLVQERGRQTVWNATETAGTRFARLPEPGACAFCLMLSSRGAVYTRQTVRRVTSRSAGEVTTQWRNRAAGRGQTYRRGRAEGMRFHDNCRCTAIESYSSHDLPTVIQDLEAEWREVTWDDDGPLPNQAGLWQAHIAKTRGV